MAEGLQDQVRERAKHRHRETGLHLRKAADSASAPESIYEMGIQGQSAPARSEIGPIPGRNGGD